MTVLTVEDDDNLRFLVVHRLVAEGYEVLEASNGELAEQMIMEHNPDIVLLDWMLPLKQGSDVCESVRKQGFEGIIIMVTAKAQDVDKIDAYNFGVSDYINKPFNMDVLIALIENKVKYALGGEKVETYKVGMVEHHPSINCVYRNDERIELTILENRILLFFIKNPNKVVSRDELMLDVWGYNADVNTRTLDMHIVRLRKKIEVNADHPSLLITVRGVGYKFNTDIPL